MKPSHTSRPFAEVATLPTVKSPVCGALGALIFLWLPALAKPHVLPVSKTTPNFADAADGYAIFLPGTPKRTTMTREFAGKKIAFHIVSATSGGFSYAVITTRAPAGVESPPPARQLDFVQEGFLVPAKNAGFTLSRREDLLSNGVLGRELILASKTNPGQIRARLFFKNPVSYQLVAAGKAAPNAAQKAQITRVLDSFRIQGAC